MNNIFYKPFMENEKQPVYFPYTREALCQKPIFPTFVFDGGAFFFANDVLRTTNGDEILEKIMDGSIFDYWHRDGKFDWTCIYKDFGPINYYCEWEGHIWLNRLYILLPLAQKYCITKDEKYAQKWYELLYDFMQCNPYVPLSHEGSNNLIWRDMQVTWRSISIVHSIFLLGDCKVFSKEQWQFIYDTVQTHANHMFEEAQKHKTCLEPDNHRLQIATTLIMFGVLFPEFFDTAAFIETAKIILLLNMKKSIFKDGCNNEDSMSYSHFIARLYVEAELYMRYNGLEGIEGCDEAIQNQYEFLYQFSSPSGKSLQIGDSYAFDAVADVEFVNTVYPLHFIRNKTSRCFKDSRMAVLRNERFDLYVDAMDMTEWHQHFGRPHFLLFGDQLPLVVDSGSINYDRGYLRKRLNSEASHNVIHCEEIPLTRNPSNETLSIEHYENTAEKKRITIKNTVTGDGASYTWLRTFALFDDRLEITDKVCANKKLHFISRIHLPDCRVGYAPSLIPRNASVEENLRFASKMENIVTDTPCELEYMPCVDGSNRMSYSHILVRRFFSDSFEEKTTIRLDKIR